MNTTFFLMAQYGLAVVPLEAVCRDYFAPLTVDNLKRKVAAGEIRLPIVRMESSQKTARGIHIQDLAEYLDARRAAALREVEQLHARGSH